MKKKKWKEGGTERNKFGSIKTELKLNFFPISIHNFHCLKFPNKLKIKKKILIY